MFDLKRAALMAAMALLASTGGGYAQSRSGADVNVNVDINRNDGIRSERRVVRERRDTSITGSVDRREERGGSRQGFCPPGQAKKPGKGSAFNC